MRVVFIPANVEEPVVVKVIDDKKNLDGLKALVGGWVETVRTRELKAFHPELLMIVDEEGVLKDKILNVRATSFYPYGFGIRGDAVLIGEKSVMTEDGPDMIWMDVPEEVVHVVTATMN